VQSTEFKPQYSLKINKNKNKEIKDEIMPPNFPCMVKKMFM
jgi:hypothetical protein